MIDLFQPGKCKKKNVIQVYLVVIMYYYLL